MANEWNVTYPVDHTLISAIPGEIRKLKDSCKDQFDHEHETPVDGDATGGEHSLGSAVCYVGTSDPTTRPGGAALGNNNIDKGRLYLNDDTTPAILERWNGTALENVVANPLGSSAVDDDDTTAMAAAHAYLANQDGFVGVTYSQAQQTCNIKLYVGATNNPAGAGSLKAQFVSQAYSQNNDAGSLGCIPVKKGAYFEVTHSGMDTIVITWYPMGTLVKCTDQD